MKPALLETGIILKEFKKGKVRDIYDLGDQLLIVATDRVSAFDVMMEQGIPEKGIVLNQLSKFWFRFLEDEKVTKTHFVSDELPRGIMGVVFYDGRPFRICQEIKEEQRKDLAQRVMIVKKTKVIPVEWIVRGYWKKSGDKFPQSLVEYTTKAEIGHDQDLNPKQLRKLLKKWLQENGFPQFKAEDLIFYLVSKTNEIYERASGYAEEKGIIIADTKFEFGIDGKGHILLVDEVLTPDSSRFWLKENWQPGKRQESLDKQPLRDWLEKSGWNKTSPSPELPVKIIKVLSQRYQKVWNRLTAGIR